MIEHNAARPVREEGECAHCCNPDCLRIMGNRKLLVNAEALRSHKPAVDNYVAKCDGDGEQGLAHVHISPFFDSSSFL